MTCHLLWSAVPLPPPCAKDKAPWASLAQGERSGRYSWPERKDRCTMKMTPRTDTAARC
jgi:hypothetical protein